VALVLFSSNIRPQYEQDVIDVLAAPDGQLQRFRYAERYVDQTIRNAWANDTLKIEEGVEILVVYSIQQPSGYHKPAYVPIRFGSIIRTEKEGSIFLIQFRLDRYAPLDRPSGNDYGAQVRAFTEQLDSGLRGRSPSGAAPEDRFSAVKGEYPKELLSGALESQSAFEVITEYLHRTVSFYSSFFWRVSRITGPTAKDVVDAFEPGIWRLKSEYSYELRIAQYQPESSQSVGTFVVLTDPSLLQVVGSSSFSISSTYDELPIRLRVPLLPDQRETVLSIRPQADTAGPSADLRFRVGPDGTRRGISAVAGSTAAVLVALPAITDVATPWKLVFITGSALLLAFVGWRGIPQRSTSG